MKDDSIQSINDNSEFFENYKKLRKNDKGSKTMVEHQDYVLFDPADNIDNPIALARIKAHLTQAQLAELLGVLQAYICKIERQKKVTVKLLNKVQGVISENAKRKSK